MIFKKARYQKPGNILSLRYTAHGLNCDYDRYKLEFPTYELPRYIL